ncbi:hypothetical protein [Streptosporangium sp. NPDC000396]|uniref:hypothetical protein n=1 Tax=Streptosporangium sp. NPDC000396 TaxID=3366185 RepID=UPI00369637BB
MSEARQAPPEDGREDQAATRAEEDQPSGISRFARSPLTWLGGVLSAVAAAVLISWTQGGGQDFLDELLGRPPLRVLLIREYAPGPGPIAFRTAPTTPADRGVLLTDPSEEEFTTLLHRHDGGAVERLEVLLAVEGGRSDLRIVDIRPRVKRSMPVLTGAYFAPDGAGEAGVISLGADFDKPDISIKSAKKNEKGKKSYFQLKQIDLKRGERETLNISFLSHRSAVEFDLEVTLVTGGRQEKQVIGGGDDGVFRVTGAAPDHRSYKSIYIENGSSWHKAGRKTLCGHFPKSRGC